MSLYWHDDDSATSPERWDLAELSRLDDQDYLADEAHRLRRSLDRQARELAEQRREIWLQRACILVLILALVTVAVAEQGIPR